jgi:hypothetical protein
MSIDQLHELSQIADDLRASADELAWRQVAVPDTEAIIEALWALEYRQVRRDQISQAGQLAQEAEP